MIPQRESIVETGRSYIGKLRYHRYGSPAEPRKRSLGLSCYDFAWVVMKEHGIILPFGCVEMYEQMPPTDNPEAADLIFFNGVGLNRPSHVGLYIPANRILQLSRAAGTVTEDEIEGKKVLGFRSIQPYVEALENGQL